MGGERRGHGVETGRPGAACRPWRGAAIRRGLGAAFVLTLAACAMLRPRPAPSWRLVRPPEVADAAAPAGVRLLPGAPLAAWVTEARFPSAEACEEARQARAREAIGAAHAAHAGDPAHEPAVRRAVNARCLEGE